MNPFVAFDLDDTLYKEIDFVKSAHNHIAHILSKKYEQSHNDIVTILDKNRNPFDLLCDFIKSIGGDEDVAGLQIRVQVACPAANRQGGAQIQPYAHDLLMGQILVL